MHGVEGSGRQFGLSRGGHLHDFVQQESPGVQRRRAHGPVLEHKPAHARQVLQAQREQVLPEAVVQRQASDVSLARTQHTVLKQPPSCRAHGAKQSHRGGSRYTCSKMPNTGD